MAKYFGTDGVRGEYGVDLTDDIVIALGRAAAKCFGTKIVIGRDTRGSGPALLKALSYGISLEGGQAYDAGIIPTPAISILTANNDFDCGIVISASHNPPQFNGIKFFHGSGRKLYEAEVDKVEELVDKFLTQDLKTNTKIFAKDFYELGHGSAQDAYITFICDAFSDLDLTGIKIAVDCANGASYITTPAVLLKLGAEVFAINQDCDQNNINVDCGSTHIEALQLHLQQSGADIGIAHDGDADRMMVALKKGKIVDGDMAICMIANYLKSADKLPNNKVCVTYLSNM
ncbi:MAG: phosphoglucosamine mutase, partial [Coriobacteriales bacterium]|nr:phosphoglucosamine mutase [Coriobacteriales bacterium]